MLRIAGSSNFVGFGAGTGTGIGRKGDWRRGFEFSLVASTNSTISDALIVNSGRYLPFAGHVTVADYQQRKWEAGAERMLTTAESQGLARLNATDNASQLSAWR